MADDDRERYPHTQVSGALSQHTPSYWRLALPALGVRYGATFLQEFSNNTHAAKSKWAKYFDAAAGLWMLGITTLFANRTLNDMRNVFRETVAYELDKNPADVTTRDILSSPNKAIARARSNMFKYNSMRALVNGTFFASWLPWKPFKDWKALNEISAINLGMGANSAYLVSEVVLRDRTFFEQVQNFVDTKLNQENALGETIHALDLVHLFERNALDNDRINAFGGRVDTPVWQQSQVIFARMAELMNRTYQHAPDDNSTQPAQPSANFTLPKFLYLIGNGLIQPRNVEPTLAYIEVANRYGMRALKQVVQDMKRGAPLATALKSYPVELPVMEAAETPALKKFTETVTPAAVHKTAPAAAYIDKVAGKDKDGDLGATLL